MVPHPGVVKRNCDPVTWLAISGSVNSCGYAHSNAGSRPLSGVQPGGV